MNQSICRNIVVLGDTPESWCAATYLAKILAPLPVSISLIKSPSQSTASSILSLPPSTHVFHQTLGISVKQLINLASGGFNLGASFTSPMAKQSTFFVPYAEFGQSKGFFDFHQILQKSGQQLEGSAEKFSLSANAVTENRFGLSGMDPASQTNPLSFGLQVKSDDYKNLIVDRGLALNVKVVDATTVELIYSESGDVTAVTLSNDQTIPVDLLLDGTGFSLNNQPQTGVNDKVAPLFELTSSSNDQALARVHEYHDFGCVKSHVIDGKTYRSVFVNDEPSSVERASKFLNVPADKKVSVTKFAKNHFSDPWQANVVQLNSKAIRFPEIYCEFFEFVISMLYDLFDLFPSEKTMSLNANEFNRLCRNRFEQITDFHDLIFDRLALSDSAAWRSQLSDARSQRLSHNIALFNSHGRLNLKPDEYIKRHHYFAVLLGSGQLPQDYHPLLDLLKEADLSKEIAAFENAQQTMLKKLPDYPSFLQQLR